MAHKRYSLKAVADEVDKYMPRSSSPQRSLSSYIGKEKTDFLKKGVESGPGIGVASVAKVGAGLAPRVVGTAKQLGKGAFKVGVKKLSSRYRTRKYG